MTTLAQSDEQFFWRQNPTRCEDYPACGHEAGDCDGSLYGSDESIIASVHEAFRTGHGSCDHQNGFYDCEDQYEDYDEEEDDE